MLFKEYCNYLQRIETIRSRNEITVILAELFKKLDKTELLANITIGFNGNPETHGSFTCFVSKN